MIPDSFYKITSDSKHNTLGGVGRDEKRARTEMSPEKKRDFGRILSNKEKNSDGEEDPNDQLIKGDELGELDPQKEKTSLLGELDPKKEKTSPLLDATTNQPETLTKDSKVAPRLGKEKLAAPSDVPWSEPYVEKNEAFPPLIKGITGKEKENVPDANLAVDSPAALFSRIAKDGLSPTKQSHPIKSMASFIPKRGEIEITFREDNTGFATLKVKPQDQDVALINLSVISLAPSDLLVNTTVLKPVLKIPSFITELVEKITSEMKDDVTTTTITLRNAGVFSGVEVTVTAFKTARSELNIQFSNMTGEAKTMLEVNLDALKQALNDKGHVVHMIIATTIKDEPVISATPSKEKDPDQEKDQNREQKRDQSEEEEA